MTKREFLDIVFALAPTEANRIMDAFDEYVESTEPHWIPVDLENNEPPLEEWVLVSGDGYVMQDCIVERGGKKIWYHGGNIQSVDRYMPLPEPYKGGDNMTDLSKVGLPRTKTYSDSTLKSWRKAELIEYIRMLERNYDAAIFFNEQQARNVEKMLKDREVTE